MKTKRPWWCCCWTCKAERSLASGDGGDFVRLPPSCQHPLSCHRGLHALARRRRQKANVLAQAARALE